MRSLLPTLRILNNFSTQHSYRYVERPYTPQGWTAMSTSHIKTTTGENYLQAIMHSISLMQNSITAFNYDFYQWSCYRLIENQQQLTKDELLMMLRLGCKYKVKIEPFHQHIENELFLRIHRDYEYQMQEYDQNIQKQMQAIMSKLQQKSQDYFQIINHQVVKQQQVSKSAVVTPTVTPSEDEKFIATMSKKISRKSRANKEMLISDILQIVELLKVSGSKNIGLLQYILELLTFKYESSDLINSKQMLQYAKLITYLCQQLMQEYQQNKQKYTPRSIKRIFKFQLMYYHEHFRQLSIAKNALTLNEIQQLVANYGAFPIKRREVRKNIALTISEVIKEKGLDKNIDFVKGFLAINAKDEKMKKTYCELIGIQSQQAKALGLYIEKQKLLTSKDKEGNTSIQVEQKQQNAQEQQNSQDSEGDVGSQPQVQAQGVNQAQNKK